MAASNGASNDGRQSQENLEPTQKPAAGFTAVNGKISPAAAPPANPNLPPQPQREAAPDAMSQRPADSSDAASSRNARRPSPTEEQVRPSTPAPATRSPPNAASSAHASVRSTKTAHPNQSDHPYRQAMSNGHARGGQEERTENVETSPPKRKRSLSRERRHLEGPIFAGNAPPPRPEHRMSIDREEPSETDPYAAPTYPPHEEGYPPVHNEGYPPVPRHAYPPPPGEQNGSPDAYPRSERHPAARGEYEHPGDPSMGPSPSQPYYSAEAHLADALQRENRGYEESRAAYGGSPEDEEDESQGNYGNYGEGRDGGSGNEADRRKRKRVFSNRTKTGCMTCRRRKKKCDEQHPECNNCLRGGFACEGYSVRNTWQKPSNAKQPIPLQSKNGYPAPVVPPRLPYPAMSRGYENGPEHPGPPPHHRASYDAGRGPPGPLEDDRDPLYSRSDPHAKSQSVWSKAARPYPSNPPQASEYQVKNEHQSQLYELPPEVPDPYNPHQNTHDERRLSTISQYPPVHSNSPAGGSHSSVQAAAQAALVHPASIRSSSSNRRSPYADLSERQRMLRGFYYYPNAPALVADRENCIQALWRFNNATNPSHGASIEERGRLFRQIMQLRPSPETQLSNGTSPPKGELSPNSEGPVGYVGKNVVVEAPFHCDYGYNINIRDDVSIGADCRISDTCSVYIGARCIFSPNVKLICATYPIDPRRRCGSSGPALGRSITIEDDCWIGTDVTILAGVRVGRSSTIGAGSLLHADVPRFTVIAGNPARVSRDIYDSSHDRP